MSSDAQKIAEIAADGVADGMHVVSEQAENMEQFIRSMNKAKLQFGLLGFAAGAAAGAMVGFAVAYRRAETKYSKIAEEEITEMREHYRRKVQSLDATAQKASLEDIVSERGYVEVEPEEEPEPGPGLAPPMAVAPPSGIVEAAGDTISEATRIPPPVPVREAPKAERRNVFKEHADTKPELPEWDWHAERAKRSPDVPYVIHYDERYEFQDYTEVSLTYYAEDDVLANERDEVIGKGDGPHDRNALIGEDNLFRFGHGSKDAAVVFIRNDQLEIMYEVVLSPNSYAEEVHGFTHTGYSRNLERMRRREALDDDDG